MFSPTTAYQFGARTLASQFFDTGAFSSPVTTLEESDHPTGQVIRRQHPFSPDQGFQQVAPVIPSHSYMTVQLVGSQVPEVRWSDRGDASLSISGEVWAVDAQLHVLSGGRLVA